VIGTGCRPPGWDTGIAIVERTLPKLAAGANATPAGAIPRIGPAGTFRKKEPAEASETGMLLKTLDFKLRTGALLDRRIPGAQISARLNM